jgi:hypothetical protein
MVLTGCKGRGETPCPTCNTGQQHGFYKTNHMTQCSECQGRGLVACQDGSDDESDTVLVLPLLFYSVHQYIIHLNEAHLSSQHNLMNIYLWDILLFHRCGICNGQGMVPCIACGARGILTCKTCDGCGSLLAHRCARVRWYYHLYFSETGPSIFIEKIVE